MARDVGETLIATPLTSEAYRPYGEVISTREDVPRNMANQGTAERFNFLAGLENRRPKTARPNVCIFSCKPTIEAGQSTFDIRMLERHPESTQLFVPMQGVEQYLVIVGLGSLAPDPKSIRAFLATGLQGITYLPGVWHH